MFVQFFGRRSFRQVASVFVCGTLALAAAMVLRGDSADGGVESDTPQKLPLSVMGDLPGVVSGTLTLEKGETVEISARLLNPAKLPANARARATWQLVEAANPEEVPRAPLAAAKPPRSIDSLGIYTAPTPNWSKLLHALDGDVYTVYRAPVAGTYKLSVVAEENTVELFNSPRWREAGKAPVSAPIPEKVAWPRQAKAAVAISVRPLEISGEAELGLFLEAEPNDTPEQAQLIALPETSDDFSRLVFGGSDDIEYFDNGKVGSSGDDWFRLEFQGTEPRLLTACLSIPDHMVAARIRCYELAAEHATAKPGEWLPVTEEYEEGKNPNERVHQQEEQHRIAINRNFKPGHVYLLRVEANAPGYELELRVVKPAPFADPRQAIRHGLYDHIGQVDSWLTNRPRGASVERRIRDTGNLLGTGCMSCHTQSGVWGPAIPFAQGYRPQNVQLFRNLVNLCYQSMRPTNELIDAANNTSLAPLDLGDGPAGTRVAGHAVVAYERYRAPRTLQAKQAIRAANFVLQSGDPGGINAAGPGANVGKGVVFNYAGEIVWTAWQKTGDPKYFRALEDKARKVLEVDPKYCDDMCHRVELLKRFFPSDYVKVAAEVAAKEKAHPEATNRVPYESKPTSPEEAEALAKQIAETVTADLERLRAIQNDDGSWGFNPGERSKGGKSWIVIGDNNAQPSPTALALIAFQAAGIGTDDPTVKKGIDALLKLQHPSGFWKGQSQTGFVSTSYALHALSRYFPTEPPKYERSQFAPKQGESLVETIRSVRNLSTTEDPAFVDLMVDAAGHESPLVRYWAMVGLGSVHQEAGVEPLIRCLGDSTKLVRVAAHWGLRQTLIDNKGWAAVLDALKSSDDFRREAAMQALVMRVDGVMPGIDVAWEDLSAAIAHAMNEDTHPAVRAWASRAAWNWWIWNPPVRVALNDAWLKMLTRPEPNAIVENCIRYQSHALFIANGHKANGSKQHQYKELKDLISNVSAALESAQESDPVVEKRLTRRLVAVAATYYNTSGGDGGPGQMGYHTGGAGSLFGDAVMNYFAKFVGDQPEPKETTLLQIALEGAANVPHHDLQQKLIDYSLNGPEELRGLAAGSVSDPRSAQLVAVPELIEPLIRQIERGAAEPARRPQLSDPVLKLFGRVRWVVPDTVEQQRQILEYLIPDFGEFKSDEEIQKIGDVAMREELKRKMESEWYLAEGLGDALGSNPDLQMDVTLESFPTSFENELVARFWLPSVTWILTYKTMLPEVQIKPGTLPPIDPYEERRSRALRFFLSQLADTAEPRTRELAVKMAQQTALRRNPEVLNSLEALLEFDKRESVVKMAKNVLSTGRDNFLKELQAAVGKESPARFPKAKNGDVKLPQEFVDDFSYFRDYVTPEMNSVLRTDQRSCFACHGVPGRVPPLELKRPDDAGYLSVGDLLSNYRKLQDRVDLKDVEKSKLLRKPLNVQSGKEDGHQGGRRYNPGDPGYEILRRWSLNQLENQKNLGIRPIAAETEDAAAGAGE